jgi:hypothetical protein
MPMHCYLTLCFDTETNKTIAAVSYFYMSPRFMHIKKHATAMCAQVIFLPACTVFMQEYNIKPNTFKHDFLKENKDGNPTRYGIDIKVLYTCTNDFSTEDIHLKLHTLE